MIKFGPAGMSNEFSELGYKHSHQMPEYLKDIGLNAFEYSGGHGVKMGPKTACLIAEKAAECGVSVSIHAPYFVNLATDTQEKQQRTMGYLLDSARMVSMMGGDRVVFHPGSAKHGRSAAMARAKHLLSDVIRRMDDAGLGHVHLCPETMGKYTLLGHLDEVLALCQLDSRIIPTLDLGHMNALAQGGLCAVEAFDSIFERCISELGRARMQCFHMHFSHIEFNAAGEVRHRRFVDAGYGPDFVHVACSLVKHGLSPVVICESSGTQDIDAMAMRDIYAAEITRTQG